MVYKANLEKPAKKNLQNTTFILFYSATISILHSVYTPTYTVVSA